MAIGKKLAVLGCYTCVATALLIVCIAAPAIVSLVNSGTPLCMPGLSIRCHESDCGRFFQRCGSAGLIEVPDDKVCYKGALLSARRTDLHSCPSPTIASNSSRPQSGLGSCVCSACSWPNSCKCMCQSGSRGTVQCLNPLKTYPSDAVARCCLRGSYSGAKCSAVSKPPMWEILLETVRRQMATLYLGLWSLQDAAASFTFQTPLSLSDSCACSIPTSGTCGNLCS